GYSDAYELFAGSKPANPASTPEVCDGNDNDADTLVDEGFPDSDGDGTKDCLEANVDTDGDTLVNTADSDDDGDGFSDSVENYAGTDSVSSCPTGPSHDAWPPDINRDTRVNVLDVLLFAPVWGTHLGDANYSRRFDLNADQRINVLDVLLFAPVWGRRCT
ncbi:MAG: dockerin type I domain-containing protein, partial [Chloroflexota bacterium]|nr:dockerin type I domain-containing protein [Chloroflexota bacterium]